jgi:hypothetical protein
MKEDKEEERVQPMIQAKTVGQAEELYVFKYMIDSRRKRTSSDISRK